MIEANRSRRLVWVVAALCGGVLALLVLADLDRGRQASSSRPTASESGNTQSGTSTAIEVIEPASVLEAPTAVERVQPAGPRGRVVERATQTSVSGVRVRMRRGSQVLAEAVSDAEGSFVLAPSESGRPRIELASDAWRASPASFRLDSEQSTGRSELRFEVERIVATPVHGRLFDQRTGEAIGEFQFVVSGPRAVRAPAPGDSSFQITFQGRPRRQETVRTDAQGHFATEGGFEAGTLQLTLVDDPAGVSSSERAIGGEAGMEYEHVFEGDGPAPELELGLMIGPTYHLDVAPPEGLRIEDLHATFPRRSHGLRAFHRMAAEDPGSHASLYMGAMASSRVLEERARLRAGAPTWVRFHLPVDLEGAHDGATNMLLHVRSDDGLWAGQVPVTSWVGVLPELLQVELQRCGSIAGRVVDDTGAPVPTAWVQRLESEFDGSVIEEIGVDREGEFRFDWLAGGVHALRVETERYDLWTGPVEVRGGEQSQVDVALSSTRPLGTVAGRLRSRTGRHRSKGGIVSLKSTVDSELYFSRAVRWRKVEGEFVAPFEFAKIPPGEYELALSPLDNLRWDALRQVVIAPISHVEFTCLDGGPVFDLGFRAVDARDGTPLERTHSIVWHGDPVDELRLDDDWESDRYLRVPADSPLTWVVGAKGFAPTWGDASDLGDGGDLREVEVRLEPGWGQVFKVTTREREPLEGVELVVDGEPVGRTDVQGLLAVSRSRRPESLDVRLEGWHVIWGSVDPDAEDFGSGLETPVYMKRD